MKKTSIAVLLTATILSAVSVFAETPNYAENLYELSSPTALTSGSSVTGGAISYVSAESLIANPALISKEQRTKLNLADTVLFSIDGTSQTKAGDAFQTGIIIPTKMFVIGAYVNGTFVNIDKLNLGNSLSLKAALSKDITEKLAVGLGMNGGIKLGSPIDWALGADLGFVYTQGNLGFLKDFRYGVSALNLGKNIASEEGDIFGYPSLATVKAGCAGSLVKNDVVNIGFNVDLTTPCFRNLILDTGLKLAVKDMLVLGVTEKVNLLETINGNYNFIPSVSLAFKFSFDIQKKADDDGKSLAGYMERHDWSESELNVAAGWKQLYGTTEAVSLGADLSLGMKDTTEPVIDIWFDEPEDEE